MNTVLAILAHESAQPTVDEFLPKWNALPCRKIAFIPSGHKLEGFQEIIHQGESAYSGAKVFVRFLLCLEALLETTAEILIVAEYDTVPLRPELPKYTPGLMISNFVSIGNPATILCALSPWVMDRPTAESFVSAGRKHLIEFGDCDHLDGLLDRWIGEVILAGCIKCNGGMDMIGYPWHEGIHRRIRNTRANWIHGFKSKADFGDLWKP